MAIEPHVMYSSSASESGGCARPWRRGRSTDLTLPRSARGTNTCGLPDPGLDSWGPESRWRGSLGDGMGERRVPHAGFVMTMLGRPLPIASQPGYW